MTTLIHIIPAQPASDGDGVRIHRLAGKQLHALLNPFLMIDEINSDDAADYIGGFPEHPHRGFETITYMKAGRMRHRDHMGNEGVIGSGDVQWMLAGAGVLHSEMPEQEQGLLHGFQIWLNLPAAEKMQPANYMELCNNDIAEVKLSSDGLARVIAGEVTVNQHNVAGFTSDRYTQPVLMDVSLGANETVDLNFGDFDTALVYVYKGETTEVATRELGIYQTNESFSLTAGDSGVEFLILSGKPIQEPIVQYGPFVMNTAEEIKQAMEDYRNNRLAL